MYIYTYIYIYIGVYRCIYVYSGLATCSPAWLLYSGFLGAGFPGAHPISLALKIPKSRFRKGMSMSQRRPRHLRPQRRCTYMLDT